MKLTFRIHFFRGSALCKIALGLCFFSASCAVKTDLAKNALDCETVAIVRNMTGLDGCQWLFELGNGAKLLATNQDSLSFVMKDGALVMLGYQPVPDAASICMHESQIVRITCIIGAGAQQYRTIARLDCQPMVDPFDIAWSRELLQRNNPDQVHELSWDTGSLYYHFEMKDRQEVYDCSGKLLCAGSISSNDCEELLDQAIDRRTIWVSNN